MLPFGTTLLYTVSHLVLTMLVAILAHEVRSTLSLFMSRWCPVSSVHAA